MAPKPDLKTEGKVLGGYLAEARKSPVAFAILEGAAGLVIVADRQKSPGAMRTLAKGLGGGRGATGRMTYDGRILTLDCEAEAPSWLAKQTQRHFGERGYVLRVAVSIDGEGERDAEQPPPKPDGQRATGEGVKSDKKAGSAAAEGSDIAEDDDETDLAAQAGDLKALILATRKKPYNFACQLSDGGVVLQAHRRRKPEILVKAARAAGGGPRGGFGMMRTEGKVVVLSCLEDPPRPLARLLKRHLKERGFFLGVRLLGPAGDLLIEEAAEDDAAAADTTATADGGAAALEAEFAALRAMPGIAGSPVGRKIEGMAGLFSAALDAGDLGKALKLLGFARAQIGNAMPAGQLGPGAQTAGAAPGAPLPPQPQPGQALVWVNGPVTGKQVARIFDEPVTAGQRAQLGYGSGDEAIAVARSLSGTAAVLIEEGEFVVYRTTSPTVPIIGTEMTTVETVTGGKPNNETDYKPQVNNLHALITGDDYVVRVEGGKARMDRDGALGNPLEGHLAAFGPGLSGIGDEDKFLAQMELAMRDVAQKFVDDAEVAAREAQAKYSKPLTPEDRAKLTAALDRMAPFDKQIADKSREAKFAMAALAAKVATLANPMALPFELGMSLGTGRFEPPWAKEKAALDKINAEIAALQQQRAEAAGDMPIALRIEDPEEFRKKSPADQSADLKSAADDVVKDVLKTRENIDDGDFDFWTMPGVMNATAAGLGLQGRELEWAQKKSGWEGKKDAIAGGAEAVLGLGLAIGAIYASGGLALFLGGAALGVGAVGAVKTTEDYLRKDAAANMSLDPSGGLLSPEEVPHVGWVVAAWVGVALDAASAVKAARVFAKTRDIAKAAEILEIPVEKAQALLEAASKGKGIAGFKTAMVADTAFEARFGNQMAEAATVITRNPKGGFNVEIVVRAGADPATRATAVAEEMRHMAQLSDPKFADDLARLTEDALAEWPKLAEADKLKALRSQLRLETDSRQTLIATLKDHVARAEGAEKAVLQAQLDEAVAGADDFARKLAELEEGMPTGKVPGWADLNQPPRLFNTPKLHEVTEAARKKLPGLADALDEVDPDGDLYYLVKEGKGYVVKQYPGAGVTAMRLVESGGVWKLEEAGRKSVAELREEVMKQFRKTRGSAAMEAGIKGYTSPYQKAYARKFDKAFRQLEQDGVKTGDILKSLGGLSDDAFEHAMRGKLREAMVKRLRELPPQQQADRLTEMMKSMPDNGSRGALFSDYRKSGMGPGLKNVEAGTNATRLKGMQRSGDGLVEVTARPGRAAKGPGPGKFLAEDKNGAAAFKRSQLETYNKALKGGTLTMEDGVTKCDGITYFFPDKAAAEGALEVMREIGASPKIHLGFYENGRIVWAR